MCLCSLSSYSESLSASGNFWIFSSSATFEYFTCSECFHYPQCWKPLNIHSDSKTSEAVTSCPNWHRPKRSGYTSNASHFWKMPLAAASSQEAAEFSQAQPVRCGRGFRPNHIRVQYLDSGSVFDTHGENGQGKCREKGKHGKLDCFVLYCIKRLLLKCSERWSERADILKLNSWLFVSPMFCEWTGQVLIAIKLSIIKLGCEFDNCLCWGLWGVKPSCNSMLLLFQMSLFTYSLIHFSV